MRNIGVDVGTGTICLTEGEKGKEPTQYKVRDAFFKLDPLSVLQGADIQFGENMLKKAGANFIKIDKTLHILGDDAVKFANLFHKEAQRPMSQGVLNPKELNNAILVKELIRGVAGEGKENDNLFFCVPAKPIDADYDIVFHTEMMKGVFRDLGYKKINHMVEGLAVVYAECQEKMMSGVGISFGAGMTNLCYSFLGVPVFAFSVARCLDENTLICTNLGFVKIKNIDINKHMVFDSYGNISKINALIDNGYRDDMYSINVMGAPETLFCTSDHKILVKEDINWVWKEAKDVKINNIVGESVVNYDKNSLLKQFYFGNKILGNKEYKCYKPGLNRNLGRFIGMFLGDGHNRYNEETGTYCIKLAFNEKDNDLIEKYFNISKILFGDDIVRIENHGDSVKNIVITDKAIAKKMNEFYDENDSKTLPIKLSDIPNNMALGIIEGLIDSDGTMDGDRISFCNTSTQLIWVMRQLLARFGVFSTLRSRFRVGGHLNKIGKPIYSNKMEYNVYVDRKYQISMLKSLFYDYEQNQIFIKKQDFLESIVVGCEKIDMQSHVYDLSIDSIHHSFTVPGVTVHNCGDWIDWSAARTCNETSMCMQIIKESGMDIRSPKNGKEQAIAIYYNNLMDYVIHRFNLMYKEADPKSLPNVTENIDVVFAGGTSLIKGFDEIFMQKVKTGFPIPVGEVRQAKNPLFTVCDGLYAAASVQNK